MSLIYDRTEQSDQSKKLTNPKRFSSKQEKYYEGFSNERKIYNNLMSIHCSPRYKTGI